jgi:hypothetical protein
MLLPDKSPNCKNGYISPLKKYGLIRKQKKEIRENQKSDLSILTLSKKIPPL